MNNPYTFTDFAAILPPVILIGMGMVVILIDLFGRRRNTRNLAYLSLLSLGVTGYTCLFLADVNLTGFGGSIALDRFTLAFNLIFLLVTGFTVLLSIRFLEDKGLSHGEVYALLLFATAGMMFMASGRDFLMIFIGLEILSISSYILCGMIQSDPRSNESALKYFLLGAFATGFLLYGMVLLYGATGSIQLPAISEALSHGETYANPFVWMGMGFLLVGFGFKLALVPFHMWTPDVYEGAPTAITAFLSTGPKAAGFAALARILLEGLGALQPEWSQVLWVLAAVTMTAGNVMALLQNNIKRMLAYSSIAHAGYILVALVVGNAQGVSGLIFYTAAYTFMNTGAFAILILASEKGRERVTFDDYAGYGYVEPVMALAMFLFMLSLAGIPLTAGFAGKFQIFKSAVDQGYIWLVVIGLLNSVVSLYYYLRIVVVMYMQTPTGDSLAQPARPSLSLYVAIACAAAGVFYLGIFPSATIEALEQSAAMLVALP